MRFQPTLPALSATTHHSKVDCVSHSLVHATPTIKNTFLLTALVFHLSAFTMSLVLGSTLHMHHLNENTERILTNQIENNKQANRKWAKELKSVYRKGNSK